jgi:hypothetical protein
MIHVLEHILAPRDFITKLWDKLQLGGLLVVEIPNYLQNPFDLLIADHCTHFTVATITELIKREGYEVISVATDWVPKELTVVARKTEYQQDNRSEVSTFYSFDLAIRSLRWLESVATEAREISKRRNFGLFGTSIAATWLFSEMVEGSVSFFVDEDPHRIGKMYMGRPIYHPREVPSGSHVLIALPTKFAEAIGRRVAKSGVTFHLPPHFTPEGSF